MTIFFKKIKKKMFPYTSDRLEYAKQQIFFFLFFSTIIMGFVAYLPVCLHVFQMKLHIILLIDTSAVLLVLFIALNHRIKVQAKIYFYLSVLYLLGTFLLFINGLKGSGFVWLFLFSVASSLLVSRRLSYLSIFLNALSLATVGLMLKLNILECNNLLAGISIGSWWIDTFNFLVVNIILNFSVLFFLQKVQTIIAKETQLKKQQLLQNNKVSEANLKLKEIDQLKSAFLANMSHEIRTPLNGIIGLTEVLIRSEAKNKNIMEILELIDLSGKQLFVLINDIIDISKIEAGQLKIIHEPVNLNELLSNLFTLQRKVLQSKGKGNIELKQENGLPDDQCFVNVDPYRLNQILINLVSNAIKFTEHGSIRISYFINTLTKELVFNVSDTGIGISQMDQAIIFQRFRQADGNDYAVHGGTGLGLTICKNLVELMGGDIKVRSGLNLGSTFTFTVPYIPATFSN